MWSGSDARFGLERDALGPPEFYGHRGVEPA